MEWGGWQIGAKIDDHIFVASREGRIVMRELKEMVEREDASLMVEFSFSLMA